MQNKIILTLLVGDSVTIAGRPSRTLYVLEKHAIKGCWVFPADFSILKQT